jgi:uncharacterized protein (DUF779 family)
VFSGIGGIFLSHGKNVIYLTRSEVCIELDRS